MVEQAQKARLATAAAGQMLTISLGVGTILPGPRDDMTAFIESVDRQLYLAKQRGRNCIVNGL